MDLFENRFVDILGSLEEYIAFGHMMTTEQQTSNIFCHMMTLKHIHCQILTTMTGNQVNEDGF